MAPDEWSFDEEWPKVLSELVEEGRFDKLWPEDDVAHKLNTHSLEELSDDELDVFDERVMPLLEAYVYEPATFEAEFARRRVYGFYEPPDPRQLTLFAA